MAEIEVPPFFLCPINLEIMKDPVTISTGITYDRDSIERWIFSDNNNTCPVTKQILSDKELTPNITVRRLIQSWCIVNASHGVQRLPTPKAPISKSQVLQLLNDVKCPQMQMQCLRKLKSIASQNQTNKRCMEAVGVAGYLASLIVNKTHEESFAEVSEDIYEDGTIPTLMYRIPSEDIPEGAIIPTLMYRIPSEDIFELKKVCDEALSILYTLQLSESTLKSVSNEEFIDSLIKVMHFGSYESGAYAIMLLNSMFKVAGPAQLVNLKPEFFIELAQVLNAEISQKATKATLKVLIHVCSWGRNRVKAGEAGLVNVLINLLLDCSDKRECELILIVLDLLCQCAEGRADLLKHGAGLAIVSKKILRISHVASDRAVRVLHSVSKFSATNAVLQEMLQVGVVAKLSMVIQVESGLKTKERAREMLKLHARAWRNSSCIPNSLISSY